MLGRTSNAVHSVNIKHIKHTMKTRVRTTTRIISPIVVLTAIAALGLSLTFSARAQTLVSGNISGTWAPSGNPYIATDNCTVPAGTNLRLLPGVIFMISENLSVTVNGSIQAVGTPTQRITIQAPISSQYWSNIVVNYSAEVTNLFRYCDFSNGRTAIDMRVYAINATMPIEIMNCAFSNCTERAIYGEAFGGAGTFWNAWAGIDVVIRNCAFNSVASGCNFWIGGQDAGFWGIGIGYANVKIVGSVFRNITNEAVSLVVGNYASGGSPATLINNTIVNAGRGVTVQDPWDARIQSCIFSGCSNAVMVSGLLSRTISYNDFFNNVTNFTGLPSTYGTVVWVNRNGTPSDIPYNIFQNPLFVGANDFHLQTNSLCIDAGTPDWSFTDMCFSNLVSQGTSFPDLGAYGGPDAVNWLDTVPLLSAQAAISQDTNGVIRVSWGALPRSEYQVQWTSNMLNAVASNWFNVSNGWVRAIDKPTSLNVATNPPHAERYYRVRSLGRTPGY
jgi:hypothetical protein